MTFCSVNYDGTFIIYCFVLITSHRCYRLTVIHEFDPYFNFRAAQYLYDNGWKNFAQWFDYKVWYPLGRPVGTTIYPGMQVTAV